MLTCPECGRKVDGQTDAHLVKMGDHLNYLKNAQCPASGKNFVNEGGRLYERRPDAPLHGHLDGVSMLALALTANWANDPMSRHRRPRR